MVAQFLEGMGKKNYAKKFLEEDITGLELLTADRDVFKDLDVKSDVDCAKIAVTFKRELMGVANIHCSMAELMEQGGDKLAKSEKRLIDNGVDVDMLVYALQNGFLTDLLKEIGISKPLERNRFEAALKVVSEKFSFSSENTLQEEGGAEYVAYSTPV